MWVWCGNSGNSSGMGKSRKLSWCFEVSMCSERYALELPLGLPNAQFPPIRSDVSKHVTAIP